MKAIVRLVAVAMLAGASALAGAQQMVKSTRAEVAPDPGKALIVFVRSSIVVGAYSAPVVHLDVRSTDAAGAVQLEDKLVGILSMYSKVAYQVEPGEHMFMSVGGGGSGHLARATLEQGKTYYMLVRPNWGFIPSFSLYPLQRDPGAEFKLDSPELAGWLKGTDFQEPTPVAHEWMVANRPSITAKKGEALQKWNAMSDTERRKFTLAASDTRDAGPPPPSAQPSAQTGAPAAAQSEDVTK